MMRLSHLLYSLHLANSFHFSSRPIHIRTTRRVTSHGKFQKLHTKKISTLYEPNTIHNDDNNPVTNKNDIRITSPNIVPNIPSNALLDIYYSEQAISALGTIGEVIEAYHAGIIFQVVNYDDLMNLESVSSSNDKNDVSNDIGGDMDRMQKAFPREFTVEWYATNFPFGAFLPIILDRNTTSLGETFEETNLDAPSVAKTGIRWENDAWAYYNPSYNPNRWTKRTYIGTIAGEGVKEYASWIIHYCQENPGYTAFELWDCPYLISGQTKQWIPSTTCSSFTQKSLQVLYDIGCKQKKSRSNSANMNTDNVGVSTDLTTSKEILMRSYAPLITQSRPTLVNLDDATQASAVREFYKELNAAVRTMDGKGMTTSQFIRLLANKLETFYVYDTPKDEYYKIHLDAPYFALASLYQPFSVPWQRLDLVGDGTLLDPGEFVAMDDGREQTNFAEELGMAAGSVVNLAKRRLPPIFKRKVRNSLSLNSVLGFGIILGSLGLVLLIVSEVVHMETSFVSGLFLGLAGGVIGSKILF